MPAKKHRILFPIVGIGASAGGIEALEKFFKNLPENSGMAFIVIQHLDPTRKGIMHELLRRYTSLKVLEATDSEKVKQNTVYVIPPNKSLSLMNGMLHLFDPVQIRGQRLPIDEFFRSLAFEQKDKSIGIILSGMGSDGSLGIKSIKEQNGIVIVQDPKSSQFDGMPVSALQSVNPDIVAPVEDIPEKLLNFLRLLPVVRTTTIIDEAKQSELSKIIILLRERTGHDFSQYKKSTLYRRVERRTGVHQIEKIHNYVRFLQENPAELDILFKEILIGVTNFFRDPLVWNTLRDKILPEFINKLPDNYILRLWVPACSTGEEVFSWAIILKETIEHLHKKILIQIFGSDLDENAINFARRAIYPANIHNDVSQDRLKRFFVQDGEGYRIKDMIRELVVFAVHNITKDPPFTKLDILSCRNLLIYMESELQKSMITLFNYSLKPDGLLVLGSSETTGQTSLFKEVDSKFKIYNHATSLPQQGLLEIAQINQPAMDKKLNKPDFPQDNIQSATEKLMLSKFSPPGVLINEQGDILYLTGKTGKFLEPVTGKANWNIHAMAKDGLGQEMLIAIRKCMNTDDPVIIENIHIDNNGQSCVINLIVQKLTKPESVKGMILIVFSEVSQQSSSPAMKGRKNQSAREKELEMDLRRSYEDLQSITEEMQASQEELKATNEELQSTNEELQSTNEELTTSKEEMQSMNEELQTVNTELQNKVQDFSQAENDMKNLLNSTEIATLFLDKQLNIRRFTDTVKKIIKLRKSDVGRPLMELASDLQYPDIEKDAQEVLDTLTSMENPIKTNNNKWFNVRIMPYRSADDRIDGLVITFTDITIYKEMEIELQKMKSSDKKDH